MKIKGGSFKSMGLDPRLCLSVPHKNPTPIQRKSIPEILCSRSIIGIAPTGSGKTLAYLIPLVQKVISGHKPLVLVPTRDLVYQVSRFLKTLTQKLDVKAVLMHGGIEVEINEYDIIISTLGKLRHENLDLKKIDMLVVDEVDRIFEEDGMRSDFFELVERLPQGRQNVYFSATLPEKMIELVSDFTLIQVDVRLSENLKHYFFYTPSSLKEAALLLLISRITAKTIIFTTTKYSVNLVSEILKAENARAIYSSMDQCLRKRNMDDFIKGTSRILVVTDLASRGLDLPSLEVVINYDMCDEKTFLHRVGRVARAGKAGTQYSLVTFGDVFNFFRIRNAYFDDMEIGSIPPGCLYEFSSYISSMDLHNLKEMAENANKKALKFLKKERLEGDCKHEIQNIGTHTFFGEDKQTEARRVLLPEAKSRNAKEVCTKNTFRDRFFIPYMQKSRGMEKAVLEVPRDDPEERSKGIAAGWVNRKKVIFGKRENIKKK